MLAGVLSQGDKRGLDVISRDVMGSEAAADDKRSALDASDTDDDDGCAEQGEGVGALLPELELHNTSSCYGKMPADILELPLCREER